MNAENKLVKSVIQRGKQTGEICLSNLNLLAIPNGVFEVSNLRELNLFKNKIRSIPEAIERLLELEKLEISGNDLSEMGDVLKSLTALSSLNLSLNNISIISNCIFENLTNLKEVNLSRNSIEEIPPSIQCLHKLEVLRLSNNNIKIIAQEVYQLTNLVTLNLNNNKISQISQSITNLINLKTLEVSNNTITSFPDISTLNLNEFHVSFNSLFYLPLSSSKIIHISNNNIYHQMIQLQPASPAYRHSPFLYYPPLIFFDNLGQTSPTTITNDLDTSLNKIGYSNNNYQDDEDQITNHSYCNSVNNDNNNNNNNSSSYNSNNSSNLKSVKNVNPEELSASDQYHYSEKIEEYFNKMGQTLTELHIQNNSIYVLPPYIKYFSQIRVLNLSNNQITNLPEELGYLISLQSLNLSNNQLEQLPSSISQLKSLKYFNLANNRLQSIPCSIVKCCYLKEDFGGKLDVSGNPLTYIPEKYRDNSSILIYLNELLDDKQLFTYIRNRVIVVGDYGVGKTALIKRLTHKYSYLHDGLFHVWNSTVGIEIERITEKCKINNKEVDINLDFWDFAGQQQYYTTHQFFLSPNAQYLLVFNVNVLTNKQNMFNLKETIEEWLNTIQCSAPGSLVYITGTHISKAGEKKLDLANQLIQDIISTWKPHSSPSIIFAKPSRYDKLGKYNFWPINNTFTGCSGTVELYHELIENSIKLSTDKITNSLFVIPNSFLHLIQRITQRKAMGDKILTWEQYKHLTQPIPFSESQLLNATKLLHQWGILIHFPDEILGLFRWVIVNPEWLIKLFSSVLTHKSHPPTSTFLSHVSSTQLTSPPITPASGDDLNEDFSMNLRKHSRSRSRDDSHSTIKRKRKLGFISERKLRQIWAPHQFSCEQFRVLIKILERFKVLVFWSYSTESSDKSTYLIPSLLSSPLPSPFTSPPTSPKSRSPSPTRSFRLPASMKLKRVQVPQSPTKENSSSFTTSMKVSLRSLSSPSSIPFSSSDDHSSEITTELPSSYHSNNQNENENFNASIGDDNNNINIINNNNNYDWDNDDDNSELTIYQQIQKHQQSIKSNNCNNNNNSIHPQLEGNSEILQSNFSPSSQKRKWNQTRVYGMRFSMHCLFSSLVVQFRNLFFYDDEDDIEDDVNILNINTSGESSSNIITSPTSPPRHDHHKLRTDPTIQYNYSNLKHSNTTTPDMTHKPGITISSQNPPLQRPSLQPNQRSAIHHPSTLHSSMHSGNKKEGDDDHRKKKNRMKCWKNGFRIRTYDNVDLQIQIEKNIMRGTRSDLRSYLIISVSSNHKLRGRRYSSSIHFEIQKLISTLYNFQVWDEVKNNCFIHLTSNLWIPRSVCLLHFLTPIPSVSESLLHTIILSPPPLTPPIINHPPPSTSHPPTSPPRTSDDHHHPHYNSSDLSHSVDFIPQLRGTSSSKTTNRPPSPSLTVILPIHPSSSSSTSSTLLQTQQFEFDLCDLIPGLFELPYFAPSSPLSSPLPLLDVEVMKRRANFIRRNFEYEKEVIKISVEGEGFSGVVWKAFWLVSSEIVAVKEIDLLVPNKEIAISRVDDFFKEVYFLSDLHHKNIIKFKGFYSSPPSYIMEYIGGGTLMDVYHNPNHQSKLTWKFIVRVASELSDAISYLHRRNPPLIHSDLKLKNILVVDWNENSPTLLKIADFGSVFTASPDWRTDLYDFIEIIRALVELRYAKSNPNNEEFSRDKILPPPLQTILNLARTYSSNNNNSISKSSNKNNENSNNNPFNPTNLKLPFMIDTKSHIPQNNILNFDQISHLLEEYQSAHVIESFSFI